MEIPDTNLSKSIIKKKKVFYLNDQYKIAGGAAKILSEFLLDKEREKAELERENLINLSENEETSDALIIEHTEGMDPLEITAERPETGTTANEKKFEEGNYPRLEIEYSGILKQEYDKGFADGKKSAVKMLENEYKKKIIKSINDFENLMIALNNEFEEYKTQFDKHIITLSVAIAEKILKREVLLDDSRIVDIFKEAINKILGVESITVLVNPADEELIRNKKSEIVNKYDSIKEITIQSNDKIERGGCKIESRLGNVDARLSSQLKIIEDALLDNIKVKISDETD